MEHQQTTSQRITFYFAIIFYEGCKFVVEGYTHECHKNKTLTKYSDFTVNVYKP